MANKLFDATSSGSDIIFKVNVAGSATEALRIQGSDAQVIPAIKVPGTQGFMDETTYTLTAVASSPTSSQFISSITGRASIPDISRDLKASMGIERIPTQQIMLLQNEIGPNGEPVYSALNDSRGLIRFVGNFSQLSDSYGIKITGSSSGDYCEVTFYGTGINVLHAVPTNITSTSLVKSVDNGAETAFFSTNPNNILGGRNYSQNCPLNVASGLTLGVHTAKIRAGDPTVSFQLNGFEVLNESSNININPGNAYIQGQRYTNSTVDSISYSLGATGSTGGRMVRYISGNDTISYAFTACASAPAYMTSADHTNEEVARVYHWREFGAGRYSVQDDFSLMRQGGSLQSAAFTLEDGTTTLVAGTNGACPNILGIYDVLQWDQSASSSLTFTFVGTGVDWRRVDASANTNTMPVTVDGTNVGNMANGKGSSVAWTEKLASGLPYGTHTVTFTWTANINDPGLLQWIVYQPKKPTIPSTAIEIADYNIMADYVNDAASPNTVKSISTGVLRKQNIRELIYSGTWNAVSAVDVGFESGLGISTAAATTTYFEYTFFGTGFNVRIPSGSGAGTVAWIASLDGPANTNWSSYTSSVSSGTTVTFTASTGTLSIPTSAVRATLFVRGLPLGTHTVRLTKSSGAFTSYFGSFDIITPIHSHKSNLYADLQNTLPVGSQSLMDSRVTSPYPNSFSAPKAWAQAVGVTSGPTMAGVTSGIGVPIPDLSVTIKTTGSPLNVSYAINLGATTATGSNVWFFVVIDGVSVNQMQPDITVYTAGLGSMLVTYTGIFPVASGTHKVDVYWRVGGGGSTLIATSTYRTLTAKEI